MFPLRERPLRKEDWKAGAVSQPPLPAGPAHQSKAAYVHAGGGGGAQGGRGVGRVAWGGGVGSKAHLR